jgi:hypothetical protein
VSESTRPPAVEAEGKRLAKEMIDSVHDDVQWRIKMSESVARIETGQRWSEMWQTAHDELDRERFARIEDQFGTVSSSVTVGEGIKNKFEGANIALKALLGLIALFAAIGGFVIWIISVGKHQ